MPTYFGPTNIPPTEALRIGTPVCYSDLPSFREHMGDAVTYVDLTDPASLADALERIRSEGAGKRRPGADLPGQSSGEEAEQRYFRVLEQIIRRFRQKTLAPS